MKTNKRKNRLMPRGIPRWIRCYDNCGKTLDRYTVCYTGNYRRRGDWWDHVGMSTYPFHPQGFGQHGQSELNQIDVNKWGFAPAMGRKCRLGKRIPFADLPADCKALVLSDYKIIWKL